MKILQITSSFFPVLGGQEKVVYEISKRLVEKGHKVTILTTDLLCEEKVPKREKLEGIEIVRFKNKLFLGSYGYSPEAIRWLKENYSKYNIVHSHGYNRHLSEFAIKILYGKIPIIFSPHGFIHTKKNYFFKIIHDITFGRFVKRANLCTALTKLDFGEYEKLGVKKEKIVEIPNGVDVEKFSKSKKYDSKKFGDFILYVGRIHESKGLQYVLEAIKKLDTKLVIVGKDAGYKQDLMEKSKKLGIEKKLIFLGGIVDEDLIKLYKSSKIFVLFSEWEGFGIVVVEAMAAGKPIIVSNRGSLPHIVNNKKEGFVVKFKDVKELHKRIEQLLNDNKLCKNMGIEGKKTSKKYEWKNIVKKYEEIYNAQIKTQS